MSYLFNAMGGRKQTPSGVLFIQTNSVTVANTVTQTALSGTGQGSLVLPANFFRIGTTIRIQGRGIHSSVSNPTITVRIKLGSTTIATFTGANGNGANDNFLLFSIFTVRTIGASGTIFTQGEWNEIHNNGLNTGAENTGTTTIDTTASQTLSVTMQWGTASASNTITMTNLTVEALNP